jgi:hypothetical protein
MNPIDLVVLVPTTVKPRECATEGMAWHTGDDVDLMAGRHPLTAVLVSPVGRCVDLGWKVVGEKQNAQTVSLDRYAVPYLNSLLVAA